MRSKKINITNIINVAFPIEVTVDRTYTIKKIYLFIQECGNNII